MSTMLDARTDKVARRYATGYPRTMQLIVIAKLKKMVRANNVK